MLRKYEHLMFTIFCLNFLVKLITKNQVAKTIRRKEIPL